MTREELEHAIRAACDVAQDSDVWVFGSQAILGSFPDAPPALHQSSETDVAPQNRPEKVDDINGALGELSPFGRAGDRRRRARDVGELGHDRGVLLRGRRPASGRRRTPPLGTRRAAASIFRP